MNNTREVLRRVRTLLEHLEEFDKKWIELPTEELEAVKDTAADDEVAVAVFELLEAGGCIHRARQKLNQACDMLTGFLPETKDVPKEGLS